MLTSTSFKHTAPLTMNPASEHPGLSRLFAAAVVSRSFCTLLLSNPQQALREGYMGKAFGLNPEDSSLIVSINAKSLPELAQQVVRTLGR
jgi:hypothetical protein